MTDALIHLRVPAATKGRWVRASRAAGMRLTDWIVQAVEAHMQQQVTLQIPDDVSFSDLGLARDSDGAVSMNWAIVERVCEASGIDPAVFQDGPEDNAAQLVVAWYQQHRQAGGEPDAVAEDLLAEAIAEERAGQSVSLPPGRA